MKKGLKFAWRREPNFWRFRLIGKMLIKVFSPTDTWKSTFLKRYPTGTPHQDIISICQRPNFDEFPRRFHVLFWCNFYGQKIHVVSTYFFRCNFDSRKTHVVSTYFFRCNFHGRKIHLVFTYLFRCNFFRRNIHGVSTYFFRRNFDSRIIHFVCTYFFRRNFDEFDVVVGKL